MDIITVDFETYYSKEFSLSKITTEEYVRDPRFQVIGVGVKANNDDTDWLSGSFKSLKEYLHDNYDWENSAVLAHNTIFDGAILSWLFDIHPKLWLDTLCMARALHGVEVGGSLKVLAERYNIGQKGTEVLNAIGKRREDFSDVELSEYGDYCINDVDLTAQLFNIFIAKGFPKKELKVIDMTLRMFTDPQLELDMDRLEMHLDSIRAQKETLLGESGITKKDLMSNNKFASALEDLGVTPPKKTSPTTGKETYAFAKSDEAFRALEEHPDLRVQALVAARIGLKSTLEETRTERFIGIGTRGTLPVPIRYYAAHTGRWGGSDKVNLQNLPSRGQNGKVLKSCIKAPAGYTLIEADSAQIEARVLAWLSQQTDLVKGFTDGEDVYKIMASRVYGKSVEDITDHERFIGKSTILGAGYGMGAVRFREQLGTFGVELGEEECKRIIRIYRDTYPNIVNLWRQAQTALMALYGGENAPLGKSGVLKLDPNESGIVLPSGLLLRYENLKAEESEKGVQFTYAVRRGRNKIYGGKVVENVCQAIARCIMAEQMLLIHKEYPVALTVHDSVVCCVPDDEVDVVASHVEKCMRYVPSWAEGLPVCGDVDVGNDYGSCKRWTPKENQHGHSVA